MMCSNRPLHPALDQPLNRRRVLPNLHIPALQQDRIRLHVLNPQLLLRDDNRPIPSPRLIDVAVLVEKRHTPLHIRRRPVDLEAQQEFLERGDRVGSDPRGVERDLDASLLRLDDVEGVWPAFLLDASQEGKFALEDKDLTVSMEKTRRGLSGCGQGYGRGKTCSAMRLAPFLLHVSEQSWRKR